MDKTLLKGLMVIEALVKSDAPRGVTELARQLGLTKSNVFRLLQTLVAQGYVNHDADSGKYACSLRLWELGSLTVNRLDVVAQGKPHVKQLAETTRESSHLTILDGEWAVNVDKVDSPEPVRSYSRLGGRAPAHCVATGKVLLAFRGGKYPGHDDRPLEQYTRMTITDPVRLGEELAQIRELGYAVTRGEWQLSVRAIGAPVRDAEGRVLAAIGISGPAERLKERAIKRLAPMVIEAGRALSADLGAQQP